MKKNVLKKVLCVALVVATLGSTTVAFAEDATEKSNIQNVEQRLTPNIDLETTESLTYFNNILGKDVIQEVIEKYRVASPNEAEAYEKIKAVLNRTMQEVEAYGFSDDQAKALFLAAVNLETGNAELTEMTYSVTVPSHAPSHTDEDNAINTSNVGVETVMTVANEPKSSRSSYETGGIGYEVKSTLGFNKTTTFLYAGDCNVTAQQGEAGYMFYTIYYDNHYQDIGIGYFDGKWQAFVQGYWTNWGTGTISVDPGDKLYFVLWIDNSNYINFQILDGNNFNNILFQNRYTTWNQIPSNGSGVGFNKQSTIVDESNDATSGLYLKDAIFELAYLYNNSTTATFNSNNTLSYRRGEFGCSWASDEKVEVEAYQQWHGETVNIIME